MLALKESSSACCNAPRQSTPPNSWSKYIVETFPHASTSATRACRTSGSGLARNLICSVPSEGGAVAPGPPPSESLLPVASMVLFGVVTTAGGAEGSGMPEKARAEGARDVGTKERARATPSESLATPRATRAREERAARVLVASALVLTLPVFFASARCRDT